MASLPPSGSKDRFVGDRFHFDQKVRVRELMNSNSGSRRPELVEILRIDFIVTREIVHVHEVGRNFDDIVQFRAHACQDVAYVLNDGPSLLTNIELSGTMRISLGSGDGIVWATRAGSRNEQIVARPFHMRELTTRFRLTFNDFAFHHHGSSLLSSRRLHNLTQMLFSSE